ncbi:hydroxyacylglutathione hydrolase [Vibrio sp. TH_r3]|uniref:hydroxyacylglutathione hydrolase n=1 Tax=Vibrio sp. TH_r3 TaxID=3082084 RepID=UPI002952BB18|nr:hydroxyacylglutathione hydrolase [Vibrio sp. TH_r3]MDV7105055.1 hydroxyacylglutathione hydrolase [Vibrio sp. TH_r3]
MLTIKSIPAFNDNYIWLIQNSDQRCAIVDPGDALPVLDYLKQHDLVLEAILITHHHQDHIGGVLPLLEQFPSIKVVGPEKEDIPLLTHQLNAGDQFGLFEETFLVLELPGHTKGHLGYLGDGKLFCGDVLFSAGCGRIFEGTAEQMFESLNKLQILPNETEVYAAHEYTSANISFALSVEPDNQDLHSYREEVFQKRAEGIATLPTTIGKEKRINPFLRVDQPSVINSVANRTKETSKIAVFTALREWKNAF